MSHSPADGQIAAKWASFLGDYYSEAILAAARDWPETRSVDVSFLDVQLRDPDLADYVLARPAHALRVGSSVLHAWDLAWDPKPALVLRIHDAPNSARVAPRHLGAEHLERLVAVRCTVDIERSPTVLPIEAAFECRFCGNIVRQHQEEETLEEPVQCDGCEKTGPWRFVPDQSRLINHQLVTIQDVHDSLRSRDTPRSINILLRDDLVDRVRAGDRLIVTAIPGAKQRAKKSVHFDVVLDAVHIERDDDDLDDTTPTPEQLERFHALAARGDVHDVLVQCLAPDVHGHEDARLAALLCLAGAPAWGPKGRPQRSQIHVLLAGDPGTAKTRILDAVRSVAPLCVHLTGEQATDAGLLSSAEHDQTEGRWIIRAGVLPRADGGHVVIDEFGLLNPKLIPQLASAMDPGQVSVAKAGIHRTFSARASVLAAMNPPLGRFDDSDPAGAQIGLPPQIQSRFDLKFALRDRRGAHDGEVFDRVTGLEATPDPLLSQRDLRCYLAAAQEKTVQIPAAVLRELRARFLELRAAGPDGLAGVDNRAIGLLERLTMASARLRLAETADEADARVAVRILYASLQSMGALTRGYVDPAVDRGSTLDQETRQREVVTIVRDLSRGEFCMEEDVVQRGQQLGMSRADVVAALERACRAGVIYRKRGEGTYAPLRP